MGAVSGVATLGGDGKLVQNVPAGNISGTISIDNLPPSAIERIVRVADNNARFALTETEVQAGDTVKVTSSGLMYMVINTASLTSESGYEPYTASAASSVPWSGVTNKPSFFDGSYSSLSGQPNLSLYSLTSHNHTGVYSIVGHTHDYGALFSAIGHAHLGVYSPVNHNHSGVYASAAHSHDGTYSLTGHTHTEYSLTVHNHDSAYSAITHNHSGTYSLTNHTHDYSVVFSAIGHDHSGVYSGVGHDHASVYAVVSHAHANYSETTHGHSYASLTDKPSLFSGNYDDLSNKPVLPSGVFSGSWNSLSDKPTTFPSETHTHTVSDIEDFPVIPSGIFSGSYDDLSDKPDLSAFPVLTNGLLSPSVMPSGVGGLPYVLPTASDTVLGGIKIGLGLSIDETGAVTASGGPSSVDMIWTQVNSSNVVAVTNHGYCADTTINDVTLTLGATPTLGDTIGVRKMNDTNTFTLAGNGNNINSQPEDINIDTFDDFLAEFVGGDIGWMVSYNFSFSESVVSYNNLTNKPDLSLFATDTEIATLQPRASSRNVKGNINGDVSIDASLGDYQTCTTTATVTNIIVSNLALETGMILSIDNTGGYSVSFNVSEILTTINNGSYACAFFNDNGTIRLMGKSRII
jgi:hypothetical protein